MPEKVTHLRPPKPCPVCGKHSVRAFHPFCSSRCADVDLNRWLKGSYAIPGRPAYDDEEEDVPSSAQRDDS